MKEKIMTDKEIKDRIEVLEKTGSLDPNCKSCQEYFYPIARVGENIWNVFAPRHKASSRCQSGKRPHCTCDICF
jgi:hypothetical protein